jgi:hypothetical protein
MSNSNRTPEKILAFCTVLAETCNVGKACAAVGMGRSTAYEWREADKEFAKAWDLAMRIGVTALEDEAHRRGFAGSEVPVVHKGEFTYVRDYTAKDPDTGALYEPWQAPILRDEEGRPRVATVREYSDTLAIFLLKAHSPEKYRERSDVNMKAEVTVKALADRMRKRTPLA